jgi:hypothetical protein
LVTNNVLSKIKLHNVADAKVDISIEFILVDNNVVPVSEKTSKFRT